MRCSCTASFQNLQTETTPSAIGQRRSHPQSATAPKTNLMAAFGVTDLYDLTVPTNAYAQASDSSQDVEVATIKSAVGLTVVAQAKPRSKTTVSIKTKGATGLTTLNANTVFSGMAITSSKVSETNDDFATVEITGTIYA